MSESHVDTYPVISHFGDESSQAIDCADTDFKFDLNKQQPINTVAIYIKNVSFIGICAILYKMSLNNPNIRNCTFSFKTHKKNLQSYTCFSTDPLQ